MFAWCSPATICYPKPRLQRTVIAQGPATEAEMILAFLRAEIDSPRFAASVGSFVSSVGGDPALITNADLADEAENASRRAILSGYRGYGCNQYLFTGFPGDTAWRRVQIEPTDHQYLLYAKEPSWIQMSDGTRLVARVAEKIALSQLTCDTADHVKAIQDKLQAGKQYPEIIGVQAENDQGIVLVEGHCRATAFVGLRWPNKIEMFLGGSLSMRSWYFY